MNVNGGGMNVKTRTADATRLPSSQEALAEIILPFRGEGYSILQVAYLLSSTSG